MLLVASHNSEWGKVFLLSSGKGGKVLSSPKYVIQQSSQFSRIFNASTHSFADCDVVAAGTR